MENSKKENQKSRRGFAAMSPERQRQIASQGGLTAHEKGLAHKWNKDEASEAGKKGGQASGVKRRISPSGHNELL